MMSTNLQIRYNNASTLASFTAMKLHLFQAFMKSRYIILPFQTEFIGRTASQKHFKIVS